MFPEGGTLRPLCFSYTRWGSGGLQLPTKNRRASKECLEAVATKQPGRYCVWLVTGQHQEWGTSCRLLSPLGSRCLNCFWSPLSSQGYLGHGGSPLGPAVQTAASQLAQGQSQFRWARPRPGVQVFLIDLGGDRGSPGTFGQTCWECGLGAFQGNPSLLGLLFNQVFLWDRYCEWGHQGAVPSPHSSGPFRLLWAFFRFTKYPLCAQHCPRP